MAHPTKSFDKPTAEDRFRVLPVDIPVREVAAMARTAGLAFVQGAAFGWRRQELRRWTFEEYDSAVAFSRVGPRALPRDETAGLADADLELLIFQTRERVLRMIRAASRNWSAPSFGRDMIDFRLVVAIYDRTGEVAYAPAAHADMRLVDRVSSLFIADFLTDSTDYELVTPCDQCGEAGLGGRVEHASWCIEAPTHSAIVERHRAKRITLRGVGT